MAEGVIVESAVKLSSDQMAQIRAILTKAKFAEPVQFELKPQLIGGLRITRAGKSIDLSLAYRLEALEEELVSHAV